MGNSGSAKSGDSLSNAELVELLRAEREQNALLLAKVSELSAQVAELLARLGTDSTNSSKPPSSDGPTAPKPRSLRGKSGRKPGGQVGRAGKTLQMCAKPDEVIAYRPDACGDCGKRLPAHLPATCVDVRQVFDLPDELRLKVTEHRLEAVTCLSCAAVNKPQAPTKVSRQVQYGPNVAAFCVYLANSQHVALGRCAELVTDLFGQPISVATINKWNEQAGARITNEFKPVAADILQDADFVHLDETGFKVAGKTKWVHSISNPQAAWIEVHDKRGSAAMDAIGILPTVAGTIVHDAWGAYDTYHGVRDHQLCNAHLLRELNAVMDVHNHTGNQWCWAEQTAAAIRAAIHDPVNVAEQRMLITSALQADLDQAPEPGYLAKKFAALKYRITDRLEDYLRFTTHAGLPPTNNPAEQEIRMVKIKQKIAGCMRTMPGANNFNAIRAYLSTARKNAKRPLEVLATLQTNNIWLPATP
jgi:transposase